MIENYYPILKDGTISNVDYYQNWVINNDTTKHKYIDPFTNKEIENPYKFKATETDPKIWLSEFDKLYTKSQYTCIYLSIYHFKTGNQWYLMEANLEGLPENFKQNYPAKEDQDVRMLVLEDLSSSYAVPPEDRNTSLIKEIGYEQTYAKKENWGILKSNYSAGWWYLDIYMPNGETIKIKRYASFRNPDLDLYKIPKAYGGRDDVLFIVQEPNPIHLEQAAGMYVIRPKNYKETPAYKEQLERDKQTTQALKKEADSLALKKRRSFLSEN